MKPVLRVIHDVPGHWVGDGLPVRSLFSYDQPEFDPFLLLDYGAPHEFGPAREPRGVGEHPHRGFETVTLVYQGELEHRDSAGHHGAIGSGDVQWMTAASGVVHEEFHSQRFTREGGTLEMIQLWVNLPAREKMSQPRYQEILARQIPTVELADGAGSMRIVAGEFRGSKGPARTVTPINLWDLQLKAGANAELAIPDGFTTALVVQHGDALVNGSQTTHGVSLVQFGRAGDQITIEAKTDLRALVLSGQPLGEPVVGRGPFVMNTNQQIQEAIHDYQAGKMGHLSH